VAPPIILATQEAEIRGIVVQSQPREIVHETPSQKYPTQKRAGAVPQGVECQPSKREALSSNPNTKKKKEFLKGMQKELRNADRDRSPAIS
jgi:hypothetical protein